MHHQHTVLLEIIKQQLRGKPPRNYGVDTSMWDFVRFKWNSSVPPPFREDVLHVQWTLFT